ncbi:MAG: apolipoprotein N-acyltransferase [Oleiphilaceae bacterium]|nr:apolipoprotein N-acyltransferase [Oleiphilaceae bacterium]
MIPANALPPVIRAAGILAAGALQTLSLAPFDWWPLGLLSLLALFYFTGALQPAHRSSETGRRGFWYGWLFGVGLFGSGASWVYVSIHVYGYASPLLAGALTLAFVLALALFHGLQFWLLFRLRTRSMGANGLLFVALWVFSDVFRSHFLTGFPWLFLGYGHLESPLSGWIPLVGVYGITFLVVLSSVLLYLMLTCRLWSERFGLVVFGGMLWWQGWQLSHYTWTLDSEYQLDVALLQTNIPQELKWHPSQRTKTARLLTDMTRAHWDKEVIIWPETALPILYDQATPYLERMSEEALREDTNIISGIPYREFNPDTREQRLHNSVLSMGVGDGIYHKQKLVPFGEYVPLQDYLRGLIAFFDLPMSDFRKGPADQELLRSHALKVAPFICYEVVYPDFVARQSQAADYLVTISNDSWFGQSIGPLQHLQMAQMRAAENSRFMLRGTNNGVTAIIDHKGRIVAQSEQFVRTTLTGKINIHQGNTPFSRYGSSPTILLSLTLLIICLFRFWKERRAVSAPAKLG